MSKPHEPSPLSPSDEIARQCCERFLPQARRIDAREVITCRADVKLAIHNVVRGVEAVLAQEATIRSELPKVDVSRFQALVELSQAVEYAARQVDRQVPSKELKALVARGRELRQVLMTAAESLATVGIFPKHVIAKIRSGYGDIDAAGDCVELAALFTKHAAAVRGKTVVNAALVKEAAEVGSKLMTTLRPVRSTAPQTVQEEVREAREVRDRLWTLLVQRHEELRRVGAYLFGVKSLDSHVPPLQSAKRASGKKAASANKEGAETMGNA